MIRHLVPRISYGGWSALGADERDEFTGRYVCIQWLGVLVEVGIGHR